MLSRRSTLLPYTTLFRSSAIASPTGLYTGYGFAVPIDLAKKVADDLIRYGRVRRPAVGIQVTPVRPEDAEDRKSTRLNSSHLVISYAVFCLKKKKKTATH